MATFSRREHTQRIIEHFVPSPSNLAEFDKAAASAIAEFQALHGRLPGDDELSVVGDDEEIVIRFVERTTS